MQPSGVAAGALGPMRQRFPTRVLAIALASALLAGLLHLASATGARGVQTLSPPGQDASSAAVAIDPKGRAYVTWVRSDGASARTQFRRRAAGGSLSRVQTISDAAESVRGADIAVDPKGNAYVAWSTVDGPAERILLRRRAAGGAFGPVRPLSDDSSSSVQVRIAVAANGAVYVVWVEDDGIKLRRRSPSGGLGSIEDISPAGPGAVDPRIAVDGKGHVHVAWEVNDGTDNRITLRRRSASGTLGPVRTLSAAGGDAEHVRIAIDGKGHAYYVWERFDGANLRVQMRRRAASGKLGPVKTLSAAGGDARDPRISVDARGNAYIVWSRSNGAVSRVQLRRRAASGKLGPTRTISAAGRDATNPQIAVDRTGRAHIAWERSDGANLRIQLRRRSASGKLGPVRTLSAGGQSAFSPHVVVDAKGRSIVIWQRPDGTHERTQLQVVPAGP